MDISTGLGLVVRRHRPRRPHHDGRRPADVPRPARLHRDFRRRDRGHADPLSALLDLPRPADGHEVRLHHAPLELARTGGRDRALAEIARKQGPIGLEKEQIDDPFLATGHALRRRRLRRRLHSRQPRARPRQLPDASRRGPEDLSLDRRLRAGLRHGRHADRHGADVRQHDRPFEARSLHGGGAARDVLRRCCRQPVLHCRSPTSCISSWPTRRSTAP